MIPILHIIPSAFSPDRQPDKHALMRRQFSAFGDFHLRICAAASAGPWHHVMTLIHLASIEALLQERPDGLVVLRGEREVASAPFRVTEFLDELMSLAGDGLSRWRCDRHFGIGSQMFCQGSQEIGIIPVHPVTKSLRLFRLTRRKPEDSSFALVDEVIDSVFVDCCLGSQPELLLDFNLDPQTLAVKAVLVSLVVSGHREETLVRILIRATPGMMDAHWVVGRDGPSRKLHRLRPAFF